MAGHSKWAKLKHTKGKTDAQKAKLFSKLVKIIGVELKKTKGDKNSAGVRAAVDKAAAANMPRTILSAPCLKTTVSSSSR